MHTTRSFCRICHAACPIDVDVDAGRVVGVRGVADDPLFEGYTCIKGRQLPDQIHHPDRLDGSFRRATDGHFERIPSTTALDDIADRVNATIDRYGPRSVAVYTGTGAYQSSCG
ncbi:MAG: oxidoreductase, partial [Acidimicrobiia bacterium]|nr:oxidoreductase [Acidimicrobiia bacterium]